MEKEEKINLINQLKERIPEFEKKVEEARQKLKEGLYSSEEEKQDLYDWAYEVFPYEDVVSSMEENLDEVQFENESCLNCGGKVVSFYFHSPDWTWKAFMGYAGYMKICVDCGKQFDFGFNGCIIRN